MTGGEFGLSPQARRLLEGTGTFNRAELLERIVGNPRGPLAKLLSREPESRVARHRGRRSDGSRSGSRSGRTGTEEGARRVEESRRAREPARADRPSGRPPVRPSSDRPVVRPTPDRPAVVPPSAPRRTGKYGRPVWLTLRNTFLLLVPASVVLNVMHANPLLVFVVACLGVVPLAAYMGEATEHLASRTGPAIGGLLNATFGNAAELIIAIVALKAGLVGLVKASITGSILGNLLLIMGLCFVAGGTRQSTLRFNRTSAGTSAGMLALAVVGLIFPALFHQLHPEAGAGRELMLSEAVAAVLAATYILSLVFSLKTHRVLFGGEPHPLDGRGLGPAQGDDHPRPGHRRYRGPVRDPGARHRKCHRDDGFLRDVPGAHHRADHRQCRGACDRRLRGTKRADGPGPPDRHGIEYPGRPSGGAVAGPGRARCRTTDGPGVLDLRNRRGRPDGRGDRHHYPRRGVQLVRGAQLLAMYALVAAMAFFV